MGRFVIAAGVCIIVGILFADVPEEQGDPRQLYSAWTTKPPKINGCITDRTNDKGSAAPGTDNDEWDDAYARIVTLNDGSTVLLLLKNDANYLYVAVVYTLASNNSANNRVTLYFDQGVGGGENDDQLTANNENMVSSNRASAASHDPWDRYWDGSSWVNDSSGVDFDVYEGYYNDVYQWEFAIPLNNGNADDLNVNGGSSTDAGDEVGFLLEIFKNGIGTFYWADTNMDPNDSTSGKGWGEIRLGKPRKFMKIAATYAANGDPIIDGSISEDAYRGCYQRDIVLTNYKGATIPARIYALHNPTSDRIYIAVKVFDSTQNNADYCQVYFEQKNPGPTSSRDYILDDNYENAMRVDGAGNVTDYFFDDQGGGVPGAWLDDSTVGDPVNGIAAASYATAEKCWHFEFRIPQNAGQYDLDQLNDDALIGFLIRYYDADKPAGENDFWWDLTVNTDVEYFDNISDTNFAIGWASLQLGAPYLQVVHPEDGATVEGTYPVDAWAAAASGSIVSVEYQVEGTTTWVPLTRVASTSYWAADWDTTAVPDGTRELRVRATDSNGLQTTQIISVTVSNVAATAAPTVIVTAPSPASVVDGEVTITFNIDPESGLSITDVEISIDGAAWTDVTNMPTSGGNWDDGYHRWDTTALPNGSHIFRVRAQDSNGRWGYSKVHLVVVSNNVVVTITSPAAGSVVNGSVTVQFDVTVEANETVSTTQISIDGGSWGAVTTPPPASGGNGSHIWDTLPCENGSHTIQVRAQDSHGRWGYSQVLLVIVDNSGPVVIDLRVHYPLGRSWACCGDYVLITARILSHGASLDPTTVVADTTAIDGVTHTMVDDGTDGDEVAGDGVFTCRVRVGVTGDERVAFAVSAKDTLGNAGPPARGWIDVRNRIRARGGGCLLMNGAGPTEPKDFAGWLLPFVLLLLITTVNKWREVVVRLARVVPAAASVVALFVPFCFAGICYAENRAIDELSAKRQVESLLSSPIMMKTNDFLHALLFVPPLETPRTLLRGSLLLRVGTRYSRTTLSDEDGTSSVNTKAGFNESYLYLAYGLLPRVELRGMFTYSAWSGSLELIDDGQGIFKAGEIGGGPGSSWVALKYLAYTSADETFSIAAAGGVKLPNGSRVDYLTTGAPDFSAWFLIAKEFSRRFRLFGELGFTVVGRPKVFRKEAEFNLRHFATFAVGVSYLLKRRRHALLGQIQGNTNAIGLSLAGCKAPPVSILIGARHQVSKAIVLEGGVGAGLTDAASDWFFSFALVVVGL